MSSLPPLSLYVHLPWCVRKCPYCDFNSHEAGERIPEEAYLEALLLDLREDAGLAAGRRLQSVFFGGGTPSLFSAGAIGAILNEAERLVGLEPDAEVTLEANPGTVEQARFAAYRGAGVNRLSIGIQSLNPEQLAALGRIHDSGEALDAARAARHAGFDNFNLDLMHGLPGQTIEQAMDDLEQVLALEPSHLSWYQLTIEPNTVFYKQPPPLPDSDVLAAIEEAGEERLNTAGFRHYEISAHARPDRDCRHNRIYWEFGDYLGIGAGAHGKVTRDDGIWRSRKSRLPEHYMANHPLNRQWTKVPDGELPLEFFMNTLRLTEGVPGAYYQERTGLPLQQVSPQLDQLREMGLLCPKEEQLATTERGRRFLNEVLAAFLEPDRHGLSGLP